jgi:hypothetical protein
MARGLLLVQSRPASPEQLEDFHRWYEDTHLPEILGVAGFISARRLAAVDGPSFLVVYEVDDVAGAKAAMAAWQSSGAMSPPVGVLLDPPPSVQWFEDLTSADA